MTLKDINFSIEMYGTTPVTQSTYQVVYTGDESSVKVNFAVTDEPDLLDATAEVYLFFGDSSKIVKPMTLTGLVFSYTLTGTQNDHAGIVRADIIITKGGAKYTRAGNKFRIDTSLEANAVLVEYAVDTLDTVVGDAEEWLLQAQTDYGTAQDQRAAEWVADNDTRSDEFTAAQASRATTFNASEASRASTFNSNETGRSNTFTTNENAREAAAQSNQAQAATDHSTAVVDHDIAVADSSLASNDHGTAVADHSTAVVDHSTASADHAAAVADQEIVDGLQDQFDVVIANATVDSEVINARQGSATLSQNLLTIKSELAETNAQVDLLNRGLGETFATLTDLQTTYPTGDTKDHIVGANGHRYYWNGTAWADGGAYQAVEVLDKAVGPEQTDFFTMPTNLFDKTAIIMGKFLLKTGVISSDYPLAFVSDKMKMKANLNYAIPYQYRTGTRIRLEDAFGNLLAVFSADAGSLPALNGIISYPQDCYAIISQTSAANLDTWMFIQSDVIINIANYIPYHAPYIPKEAIENLTKIETDVTDLKADVTEILEATDVFDDTIIGYGDSLTAGTGGNGTTYLTVVQSLLTANGKTTTTINRGGGGETCNGINSRIGAFPIILNPFTLPAGTSTVAVTTKTFGGETVNNLNRFMRGVNPCYIDGIACTLSRLSDADPTLYLNRNVAGTSVVFDRPKRLVTDGYLNDRNSKIFVIWMGTNNDTYTAEQIIQKQRLFVDTIKTDKYIILGITQDNEPNRITHNNAMAQEWGSRFLDIREYLIECGLQDVNITPTTADTDAIALGKIPPSLLFDDTHFNKYGYTVIGQQVYRTIDKLGFLACPKTQ